MGLSWNDKDRQWEWEGSVRGLVAAVGSGDAQLGPVLDRKSGAKISMNMNDVPEPGYKGVFEPFYVLASDGENMYDAYNRQEAAEMLTNAREEKKPEKPKHKSSKKRLPRVGKHNATLRGLRR